MAVATAGEYTRERDASDIAEPRLAQGLADAARRCADALEALLAVPTGEEARLVQAMRYASLGGGKRLRGLLVLQSAALFDVPAAAADRVAAAVEMLHAYSLVHDDLPAMDDDDLRRGKPTTHCAFDEATAILAGDALQTRAFEVLAGPATHADPSVRCELVLALALASGAEGMAGGQMIDMLAPARQRREPPVEVAEVLRLQALKTGRLIRFAAEAGAILGRADAAGRRALAAYGADLGAAFQIADDLLDATVSAEEAGKATGKDAAAGKATLISLLGPARARAEAETLAARAAARLDGFGSRADLLRQLAAYVVSRRS